MIIMMLMMIMLLMMMMLQDRGRQLHMVQGYDDDNVDDDVTG